MTNKEKIIILSAAVVSTVAVLVIIILNYLHMKEVKKIASTTTANNPEDLNLPRGYRNNNPLNIRISSSSWQGKVKPNTDGSFEQFENMGYGFRAALKLLRNYISQGHNTITKMINRWAPPTENNTSSYVTNVANRSGIDANTVINRSDKETLCKIAYAMAISENGSAPLMSDVEAGWEML